MVKTERGYGNYLIMRSFFAEFRKIAGRFYINEGKQIRTNSDLASGETCPLCEVYNLDNSSQPLRFAAYKAGLFLGLETGFVDVVVTAADLDDRVLDDRILLAGIKLADNKEVTTILTRARRIRKHMIRMMSKKEAA